MRTTLYGIDDLVVALRDLGGVVQPVKVAAALRGIRVDDRTIAAYCSWSPGRYTRNLVARTDAFELIALCWDAGACSSIHDHADSDCAFVVQSGAIACQNFRVAWAGTVGSGSCELRQTGTRTLRAGELDMRSGHLSVHRVGAAGGRAITLHVYAKPIEACLNFGEDGTVREVGSRYDTVPA